MNQLSMFDAPNPPRPPKRLTRIDADRGRKLAERGADRAADGAEAEHADWKAKAMAFFIDYGRNRGLGARISIEDVRHASAGIVPIPRNARAWGHIALQAKKQGIVTWGGFEPTNDPKSHGCPRSAWIWNEGA